MPSAPNHSRLIRAPGALRPHPEEHPCKSVDLHGYVSKDEAGHAPSPFEKPAAKALPAPQGEGGRTCNIALRQVLLGLAFALPAGGVLAAGIDKQDFKQIEHGHYLATIGDCGACHTLPGSGHDFAGGRPLETPFGLLIAPNITPDPQTGIGAWTDDEFVDALTKGKGRNGTRLYPAMPFTYYTKVAREDALAIRAYLNTVPAVSNAVQPNQLWFPLNIRSSMAAWDALFFKPGPFAAVAGKSPEWNRGGYLAEGLGHCGMCHTPKNFLGADKTGSRLQGYALQGWFAPDITNAARGGLGS